MKKNRWADYWLLVVLCYIVIGFSVIRAAEPELKKALALVNEGKTQEAVNILRQEVEKGTATSDTHLALGVACLENGDYGSAKSSLEKALALDPVSVPGHYTLAMIYEKERSFLKAAQEWRRVLQLTDDTGLKELAEKHIQQLEGIQ